MADTPGLILKSTRESKNFNIAQVAKGTRIRIVYIQAMEADDFASLPSPVHVRGFLRICAEFLGLDTNDLITKLAPNFQHANPEIISNPPAVEFSNKLDALDFNVPKPSSENEIVDLGITTFEPSDELSAEIVNDFQYKTPHNSDQPLRSLSQINSKNIFSSIGEKLRDHREALGLSLNEVEKQSHVLKRYLESIEAGEFENLPSSVQARGMLANYARFLEIASDEILLLFADGLQAQRLEKQQPGIRHTGSTNGSHNKISALRRYISIDLLFGSGMILLLIVYAVWGTGKVIDLYNAPASDGTVASISDIILSPIHTASVEGEETIQTAVLVTNTPGVDATQISGIPADVQGQVQVYVIVLQRTWLRIMVDNKISLEGRVEQGNAYSFNGNNQVEVLTGNGAALQIIHNQTDLGVMGVFGQIVDNIYTKNSIIKPTATITPTPTITPIPSITPRTTTTNLP
jgi:cytoskeletal protein RodZ